MVRGKFITLEGCEGAGKTTNIQFIREYLSSHGISVVLSREPGGTWLAEELRKLLLSRTQEEITEQAELLMIFAARSQHIEHVVLPALTKGSWVVCDRFTDATYAYQGGGRCLSIKSIQWLEHYVQAGLIPDLTLLFDIPTELGICRARIRSEPDRFESEDSLFFERVRRAYLVQAELNPERIKVIDTDRSLPEIQSDIIELLNPFLAKYHVR
ncbi:MAG: dTMP kinase [Gammaproteobacteria bacterium]